MTAPRTSISETSKVAGLALFRPPEVFHNHSTALAR